MASPKLQPVELTDDERQVLEGWARRRKTAQALALRSRIVLACADGGTVSELPLAGGFQGHGVEVAVAVPEIAAGGADR